MTAIQSIQSLSMLYEETGRALHKAQMVEYNLVSVMIILSKVGPAKPKEKDPEYWIKGQLGQLLKPIIDSNLIPEDAKLFLQTMVNARNHLAHNLFIDIDMSMEAGIQRAIREVQAMQSVFDRGFFLMEEILKNIAGKELGINLDEIKMEAAKKIKQSIE